MADTDAAWDAGQFYERLGVTPIINAAGSITRLGGSRTRPRDSGADVTGGPG